MVKGRFRLNLKVFADGLCERDEFACPLSSRNYVCNFFGGINFFWPAKIFLPTVTRVSPLNICSWTNNPDMLGLAPVL